MAYKLIICDKNIELPGVYMFYEDARKAQKEWEQANSPFFTRIVKI